MEGNRLTYIRQIKSTNCKKITLNWWEYWIGHCWMTGWQSIRGAFCIWRDLMTDNYKDYTLLHTDDPFTECYEWFWVTLGEDECYPKFFLEDLLEMTARIERGEEKLIPMNEDFMEKLKDLVKDVEFDDDL